GGVGDGMAGRAASRPTDATIAAMLVELAPNNPYTLTLKTPLVAAAGCLGYGVEVARQLGLGTGTAQGLGALITRTTTLRARRERVQLLETPAGLIYAGANNPGWPLVRKRIAPNWANWDLPVILSVAVDDPGDLGAWLPELDQLAGVGGVELNLAQHAALNPTHAQQLVGAARASTPLPLLITVPGYAPALAALAQAAVAAGADALIVSGATPAAMRQADGIVREGMLCGPAIYPLTLRAVAQVAAAVQVPLLAVGGVRNADDVGGLQAVGATAVGLGSALLTDLRTAARIMAILAR
ncbi:MAG: hypothetical protein AB4911_21815, partial [Oscillochloridaceae bacterium umkhey_bin13]